MHNLNTHHFIALKRILCYIKGIISSGLHLKRGPLQLIAYSDANWAGDTTSRHSTTRFCVFLGSKPVSWSAKKQSSAARSSTEAKYKPHAHTAAELSWLRMLLKDLHIFLFTCPLIWCDNIYVISLAPNPNFHA